MTETLTHSQGEEEIKRGCEEEREDSPVPIFPPLWFGIVRYVSWLNGFSLLSFSSMGKTWFKRSETSTHSHPEEEIERGHEEEREGSPIPIFPPLRFGIVRLLTV